MSLPNKPLVGLVGGAASGKDLIASLFVDLGFVHVSASDILREEMTARQLTVSRHLQTIVANETRRQLGGAYFIKEALKRVSYPEAGKPTVVSGVYSPAEGQYVIDLLGNIVFVSTGIDNQADDYLHRYSRLEKRSDGSRDELSFQEFLNAQVIENSGSNDEANIETLRQMASFLVINAPNSPIDILKSQVDNLTNQLGEYDANPTR